MIADSHSGADRLAAGDGHVDRLVDPRWIAEHLEDPNVRLVEVDVGPAAYAAGHLPGAVPWNAYSLRYRDYTPIGLAELAAQC